MTLDGRSYDRANQPAYPMQVNSSAVARIYVVPRAPGGAVDTPLGVIQKLTDLGAGPRISGRISQLPYGRELVQSLEADFKVIIRAMSKRHADAAMSFMANTKLATWAQAVQETFLIAAFNYPPVEVNDARVVRLTPGPGIQIGQTPDFRYTVRATAAGQTGIKGDLVMTSLLTDIGNVANLNAAIQVGSPPPNPNWGKACTVGQFTGVCTIDNQCVVLGASAQAVLGSC